MATSIASQWTVPRLFARRRIRNYELAWYRAGLKTQEVFNLCRSDQYGNAIREANSDWARDIFHCGPQTCHCHEHEDHSGH